MKQYRKMKHGFVEVIPLKGNGEYFYVNETDGRFAYKAPQTRISCFFPATTGHIHELDLMWDRLNPTLRKAYKNWRDNLTSTEEGIEQYNKIINQ